MRFFVFFLIISSLIFSKDEIHTYNFKNDFDEKRVYTLQKEVSCPLCEGSSIAGSNAPIAVDIKNKIYLDIVKGKSNEEILTNLRDIFGNDVTYKPTFENNMILWFLPVVLLLAIVFAARIFLKKNV